MISNAPTDQDGLDALDGSLVMLTQARAYAEGLVNVRSEPDDDSELAEEERDLLNSIRTAGGGGLVICLRTIEYAEALEARGLIELDYPPEFSRGIALAIAG